MVERTDEAGKLRAAQEYFRSLGIEGWEETNSPVQGGGQATILVVKRRAGARGAFRFTSESDEKALARFAREIKILSEYEHPNILKILGHSKDTTQPWYISELGDSFVAHWKRCRQQFADDPVQLVRSAIDVVRQIASGLAPLHEKTIVHRDIKPANIIVKNTDSDTKQPVLIDFGLAYIESEPRLSDVNETVGNLRFSHDVAMYHMDNVPSWLDVHDLAQLFMWMTRVYPDKNWQRALDPRWVKYDNRLPEDLNLSIRAFTALCSEENVSPKNARGIINLLDQLFPQKLPSSSSIINISKIEEGRRRGMAVSSLALADDTRMIEASFPIVTKTYLALRQELDSLFGACGAAGIRVDKVSDREIDNFPLQLFETTNNTNSMELVHWEVGDGSGNAFSFRIRIIIVSSRLAGPLGGGGQQFPPDSSNPFYFQVYSERPRTQTRGDFPHKNRFLTLNDQGSLFIGNSFPGGHTPPGFIPDPPIGTSIPNIVEMVKEWIEDPEVWEALHKFK